MSITYQASRVDADDALIGAQAALLEAEHQAIIREVLAAEDFFCCGTGSVACDELIAVWAAAFR